MTVSTYKGGNGGSHYWPEVSHSKLLDLILTHQPKLQCKIPGREVHLRINEIAVGRQAVPNEVLSGPVNKLEPMEPILVTSAES